MAGVNSGMMRGRFEFLSRPDTSGNSPPGDGYGNVEGDFEVQFTLWAEVKMLKGSEPVLAQRLSGVQPRVLKIRQSAQSARITTAWSARDIYGGESLNIMAVTPDPQGRFVELLCESGTATG